MKNKFSVVLHTYERDLPPGVSIPFDFQPGVVQTSRVRCYLSGSGSNELPGTYSVCSLVIFPQTIILQGVSRRSPSRWHAAPERQSMDLHGSPVGRPHAAAAAGPPS